MHLIKTYKPLTPADCLEFTAFMSPVTAVTQYCRGPRNFEEHPINGISLEPTGPRFQADSKTWAYAFQVIEVDITKSPNGVADLEPWLAYLGRHVHTLRYKKLPYYVDINGQWTPGEFNRESTNTHYAVDVRDKAVRKAWPELCDAHNYRHVQEVQGFLNGRRVTGEKLYDEATILAAYMEGLRHG